MTNKLAGSMLKNALLLGAFSLVFVLMVALTQQLTQPFIDIATHQAKVLILADILPKRYYDQDLMQHQVSLAADPLLGQNLNSLAIIAQKDQQASAVILTVKTNEGYSGTIELLVAIDSQGQLIGVRALKHQETPGLGDKIDLIKTPWVRNFEGFSLKNLNTQGWAVKKDHGHFDQFAGATITPRAVVKAVHKALQYFDAHRTQLLQFKGTTP